MFIELVDHLRCVRPHEESWLVVSTKRMDGRDIMEGVLGCPVCHAEYRIERGIALFAERQPMISRALPPDESEAMRLAAFLDLADPRGYAILAGVVASHARVIQRRTDVHLLLVDPPNGVDVGAGLSGLTADHALPLAAGSARAAALDASAASTLLGSAIDAVRAGGRVVAPISVPVPPGVTELVRDDRIWVAERRPSVVQSRPVMIRRSTSD